MKSSMTLAGLMTALAISSGSANAATFCTTVWTSDGFVAMRQGPSTAYSLKKKLWFQSTVKILNGTTSSWQKVKHGGSSGWVHANLIDWGSCW